MTLANWIQALSAAAIAVLTGVLVWLTRKYATANERMARSLERDFTERYRPYADLECEVVFRDSWVYSLEIRLANKGLSPLRIDRLLVRCGTMVFHEERALTLAVGETRALSVRFSLHDLALQTIHEGDKVELELSVEYRDLDNVTQRIVRYPWLEYRERPPGR